MLTSHTICVRAAMNQQRYRFTAGTVDAQSKSISFKTVSEHAHQPTSTRSFDEGSQGLVHPTQAVPLHLQMKTHLGDCTSSDVLTCAQ